MTTPLTPTDKVTPQISVVIPAYNHARYVVEAIQSVLAQDFTDYEIIVVDDGSKDSTRAAVAPFGDKVRYIWQENRGLSGARNMGIQAARAPYIALLDADDLWEPNFLSFVYQHLSADPSLGAVHTGSRFVDSDGRALPQSNTVTVAADQMYERLVDGEFFAADAVLVRREVFDKVGFFDLELRASEDWEMWLRVARAYRFGSYAEPLLLYRMHGENMSADPEHMMRYQLMVLEKHFGPAAGDPQQWPRDRQRSYACVYYQVAQGYFLRNNTTKGQQYLGMALEANPEIGRTVAMYYELGCMDQGLGRRGPSPKLNLAKNAQTLLSVLNNVFAQPNLSPRLLAQRTEIFAHAWLGLGTLAYHSEQSKLARHYLWQAFTHAPVFAYRHGLLPMLVKSLLDRQTRGRLKALLGSNSTMQV
jgi:glycosyltransferase involved in cell wall biosynthesis